MRIKVDHASHTGRLWVLDSSLMRMGAHHTEDKGDLGTAKAHADLVGMGYMVLFPATEHAAFDLGCLQGRRVPPGAGQVPLRARRGVQPAANFRAFPVA
jgi:hypothetical protein